MSIRDYRIRVQRWVRYDSYVTVSAESEREAREKALRVGTDSEQAGVITKNKTTILGQMWQSPVPK